MATALDTLVTVFRFIADPRPVREASVALQNFQQRIDQTTARIAAQQKRANALAKSVGGMFLSMYAGRRAIRVVSEMKDTINEFELAMNLVESKTSASREEMERMRRQAIELGATTVFTASQAGEAQAKLAQAGFDVAKIYHIVPAVLNLASAGSLILANSAAITSDVLRGYNLDAQRAAQVTDLLAAAAANSKTTVQELAPMFRYALAPAAFTKTSIPDLLAINAVLRNTSLVAGQAGRGMREMLTDLAAPTPAALKAMAKIGIIPSRIAKMVEEGRIVQVMEELNELRDVISLDIAKDLVGTRHMSAFMIWLDKAKQVSALSRDWANMNNEAQKQADIMMKGLPGAIKLFESIRETFIL